MQAYLQWTSVILFLAVIAFLIAFGVAAFTAIRLAELTGAPVAWYNMAILSALTAVAYAAHSLAPRR